MEYNIRKLKLFKNNLWKPKNENDLEIYQNIQTKIIYE